MPNALQRIVKRAVDYLGDRSKSIYDLFTGLSTTGKSFVVNEAAVLSITPAWRAIYILKDILATMPLGLYEEESDGDIILRKKHPLHQLIAVSPHPLYTPFEWMSAMIVNALICGNAISRIVWNGSGIPVALEIIPYDKLQDIILNDDGKSMSYILTSGKALHSSDVIHFTGLSVNGLAGLNTTQIHKDTFASEMALRDYVKSFLENGAFPSGVLQSPTMLSDQAYKKLDASWGTKHGGPTKTGKTAILEGGMTYHSIQSNIHDSGYDTLKKASISDISRIYGVPAYMLDPDLKPNNSGAEQMALDFKRYTLDGWVTKIKQELTRKLVSDTQSGRYFFDYDQTGLTTGDIRTMGDYYQKLFNIGVLNRDEIRAYIKKNKVEDGERYFIQTNNMTPTDMIDQEITGNPDGQGNNTQQDNTQN